MALTPRLEHRLSQSLVMTPQLQQAIKLLQLSNFDLLAYVEGELERNPLLERDDGAEEAGEESGLGTAPGEEAAADAADDGVEAEGDALEAVNISTAGETPIPVEETLDVDYNDVWSNDSAADGIRENPAESGIGGGTDVAFDSWGASGGQGFEDPVFNLEQTVSESETLRDHMMGQLQIEVSDPVDRMIGILLIDMLDETGYITGELAVVAEVLGCSIERVEAALEILQQFDPSGIFARDLAECLALQLRERDRLDPAMQALLDNLDLLAKHQEAALHEACGVDQEDLVDMVAEIRSLDPKPGLVFDDMVIQPVIPDVLMRPHPSEGWVVELNNDTLPKVLVNNRYYAEISRLTRDKEEKRYINESLQSANWLVKSLHQRATTILKVASEIVRQQDAFFAKGVKHLRPLVLRDIAQVIEMHESTVSRVTSNKFMATPRGIFELKYFFTPAIGSTSGGASHSAESVRHSLKGLIDNESAGDVLSDDRIVEILRAEGIDIARRTVAKYRETMGIASSVQRRREKTSRL